MLPAIQFSWAIAFRRYGSRLLCDEYTSLTRGAGMAFSLQVLALGYSVGRVEEMHSAAARGSSSKLITRQLVRIYTPGTAVEGLLAVRRHSTPPATCTYASMEKL